MSEPPQATAFTEPPPLPPPPPPKPPIEPVATDDTDPRPRRSFIHPDLQSPLGYFAISLMVVALLWVLGAWGITAQLAERSRNDEASVMHQIYELLAWWAAFQLFALGAMMAAFAVRFSRAERAAGAAHA